MALALAGATACRDGNADLPGTHLDSRPSPDFRLTDQAGRTVALADLRGQSVVVTFLYTACPDFCPLTAEKLRQTIEALGKDAGKVAIIGISVDPDRDSRAAAQEFTARHRLPEMGWHYLVGAEAELAPVWQAYGIGRIPPQPAAGRGAETLGHTEVLYVIDGRGRQRTLLRGDFEPKELAATLRRLAG